MRGGRGRAVGSTVTFSSSFTGFSAGVDCRKGERGRIGVVGSISSATGWKGGGSGASLGRVTSGKAVDGFMVISPFPVDDGGGPAKWAGPAPDL